MAQWMRQFSGNTHLTRIQDREKQLRHAVETYEAKESKGQQDAYLATLIKFAEKLLNARIKAMKAQIASLDPRDEQTRKSMESRIERMSSLGIVAILSEFGVDETHCDNA